MHFAKGMRLGKKQGALGKKGYITDLKSQFALQSMIWPALITMLIFSYIPMYGIILAFRDANNIMIPFSEAPWVAFKNFESFLKDPLLWGTVRNTLVMNFLALFLSFPAPILLALLISEAPFMRFKKVVQTASYLPYFLSWAIFGGIMIEMLMPGGIVSSFMTQLTGAKSPVNLMADGKKFYLIFTLVSILKSAGYGSILYLAAISGIDSSLYEAATMDGCSRLKKIWYITLPCIGGTIAILFILQISTILNTGIEQLLILQNASNLEFSETLDTYVYKIGIKSGHFSYATAVGLLKSLVSVLLLISANGFTKRYFKRGLF